MQKNSKNGVDIRCEEIWSPIFFMFKLTETLGMVDGDKLGEALGMDEGMELTLGLCEIVGLVVGA